MRLYFQQRLFSWFDSYDIYDEAGSVVYTVHGEPAWGHRLRIYDGSGREVGCVREVVLTFLPRFEFYVGGVHVGTLTKELSFLHPRYNLDYSGWHIEGNWIEWDYEILDAQNRTAARISKELLHLTDTYWIDAERPADALPALMVTLAIDAEKCSRG